MLVLPDVLANAGGVVVSYFEWVQGLQEYFWKESEVNAKLNDIVTRAFEETWATHERKSISMRIAALRDRGRARGRGDDDPGPLPVVRAGSHRSSTRRRLPPLRAGAVRPSGGRAVRRRGCRSCST